MKNLTYILLTAVICTLLLPACAQKSYGIVNSYAYKKTFIPGNIMVDENNNPLTGPEIQRFIYIETKGSSQPVITQVFYNGTAVDAAIQPVDQLPAEIGRDKAKGQDIVLSARPGHRLWKIEVAAKSINKQEPLLENASSITIKGHLESKPFTYTITKETELASDITY